MTWHILPRNDCKQHEESSTCDCKPSIVFKDGELVVIHNAYDKRELLEELIQNINNN
jgi:hypothetical protein